jgi:dienelactone hydrolase
MRARAPVAIALALALAAAAAIARAQTPAAMNEQVVMVKVGSGLSGAELETTVFRPDGEGPFPAVVINHGKAPGNPVFQERARFLHASREFVRRGYAVVLPMRMGFSRSSGAYIHPGCNIASNGEMQAEWVEGVLAWMRAQPFVDPGRIVVAGQSHGGLTTLALGARNPPGVRGLINFAGGLKIESCIWESALAQAFAQYGARAKIPSLWFYGDNDSYFPPAVWKDLHARYTGAGGEARMVAYGSFGRDAHGMFASRGGLRVWVPEVEKFLDSLGLPSRPVITVSDVPRPPRSDFAAIDDVAAVPHVRENGRKGYATFLQHGLPRAFAVGPKGAWGWAAEGDDPSARALANCQKHSREPCRLYAVDEDVVWRP